MFSNQAVKFPIDVMYVLQYNNNLNYTESWIKKCYVNISTEQFKLSTKLKNTVITISKSTCIILITLVDNRLLWLGWQLPSRKYNLKTGRKIWSLFY